MIESVAAELQFDGLGYPVFWQITTPGIHGVDLLLSAPDERLLALEAKGTLRPARGRQSLASRRLRFPGSSIPLRSLPTNDRKRLRRGGRGRPRSTGAADLTDSSLGECAGPAHGAADPGADPRRPIAANR